MAFYGLRLFMAFGYFIYLNIDVRMYVRMYLCMCYDRIFLCYYFLLSYLLLLLSLSSFILSNSLFSSLLSLLHR